MSLPRIVRSGWRDADARPQRVSGINSGKTSESFHEIESSPSLLRSIWTTSSVSGINVHSSGLKDGLPFGARGISVMPHCPAPSSERVDYESDVETEKLPGLGSTKPRDKPRVVVLGTGWTGCQFLKGLDMKLYDVICISLRNRMVFTPLLASTCVGTLEFRSVAEPVSRI